MFSIKRDRNLTSQSFDDHNCSSKYQIILLIKMSGGLFKFHNYFGMTI
ncbi:hypothetical protein Leryth_026663 [Lithospermum erythrorhizon]|nr:hypothetical protein Leryth_026663 [Lithospermum erythrorhizon]